MKMTSHTLKVALAVILVICANVNIPVVSGFNVQNTGVVIRSTVSVGKDIQLCMVATGRKGKAASSKADDLEKTVALILKHDEKMSGAVTWKASALYESKDSSDSSVSAGGDVVNGDSVQVQNKKNGGLLKRIGSKLKFWKKK